MKIGILTFHRSLNYGAELQALALMTFLREQGYEASIIDYWPDYRIQFWKETLHLPFFQMLRTVELRMMTCIRHGIRKRKTEQFINKNMVLTPTSEHYDVAIYGSDQIWRKFYKRALKGFDKVYWGDNYINADHRITYAASLGTVKIIKAEDNNFISEHVKNFKALSCREQDLTDYFITNFKVEATKVLDPIFLLSPEQWNYLLPDKNVPTCSYILCYTVKKNILLERIVDQLKKQTGLPVIEMRGALVEFHYGRRYRLTGDAQEFLSLIRNSSYVVASSFHGVALSLRFNKEFFYTGDKKSVVRIHSLLSEVGLQDRIIEKNQSVDANQKTNWDNVNNKLNVLETSSKTWLTDKLSLLLK